MGDGRHVAGTELALPSLTLVLTNLSFFSNVKRRIMSFYLFFFLLLSAFLSSFNVLSFYFFCFLVCQCVYVCVFGFSFFLLRFFLSLFVDDISPRRLSLSLSGYTPTAHICYL